MFIIFLIPSKKMRDTMFRKQIFLIFFFFGKVVRFYFLRVIEWVGINLRAR